MLPFLYQFTIGLFAIIMKVAALFNDKAKRGVAGRKGLLDELEKSFQQRVNGRPVAWFHAASLGEFEQGRPVMESFRSNYPDHFILLTFFSPSGYEIRKNYAGADYICYLPIDTLSNARRFVHVVKPQIVFFIKYEFWFNYLSLLRKSGAYVLSFSAIFRPQQIFFKPYGGFFREMLDCFDHIFVQNQESLNLLHQAGILRSSIAGDTRFDRVKMIASNAAELQGLNFFVCQKPCLVAGSVWEADMQVLVPVLNHFRGTLKAIIAPHEINAAQIENWRKSLHGTSILYSELKTRQSIEVCDYLFIDNIGMLSSLYKYGNMAFIGGSFGSGLHNILEAATFGLPVAFGNKKYHKFQEATDLIQKGGAVAVSDSRQTIEVFEKWIKNSEERTKAGKVNEAYISAGTGSTETIMNAVRKVLD
ncbi:3-deoxy-D-manno-octulosonic acid transferase [Dyadobacter sediminis]|uniref:3-deoxy-D-manno-octulosonic acid transferase n=1 Tax=Dyadobacter sediminis TaxID=1493691 RepID=A0A5R9KD95_9BACT|nr:glycosyltransferase N-terminal domain-containing protein [Dyadobacter sediminis]TLU94125.1 3-deoxy-D-manno-octulosonic acid transferase [Dyadobacter sediminis]GGB94015.1 3-deoxy-D-manno-octulosonic acid transferase [Dyadobacter sediminis]